MQDLIERRAALTALCEDCLQKYEGICPHPASRCVEFRTIKQLPAIEAEPVRHGRWIEKPPYADETVKGLEFQIVCSRCDEQNSSITFDENSVPIAKTFYRTRYCPNCGADMRGVSEDAGS